MKTRLPLFVILLSATGAARASTVYYTQDFETTAATASSGYTISDERIFSTNYFLYTNASASPGSTYADAHGGFVAGRNTNYFSGYDFSVTTDSFDITGATTLQFAIDLATHTTVPSWEATSVVNFQYQVDGGGWASIFDADSDGANPGAPMVNGVAVTNAFSTFTSNITGLAGTSLQIRVVWANLNPGDSLAIDNITVSAVPLPTAAFAGMGFLGLLGVATAARRRMHA